MTPRSLRQEHTMRPLQWMEGVGNAHLAVDAACLPAACSTGPLTRAALPFPSSRSPTRHSRFGASLVAARWEAQAPRSRMTTGSTQR